LKTAARIGEDHAAATAGELHALERVIRFGRAAERVDRDAMGMHA
jgi:hypothetical protein